MREVTRAGITIEGEAPVKSEASSSGIAPEAYQRAELESKWDEGTQLILFAGLPLSAWVRQEWEIAP